MSSGSSMQRVFAAIAIASCLVGVPAVSFAQTLPGLTFFSGVRRENQLNYRLDFGGQAGGWDRYRLRISPKKMNLAVAQFAITYPDYFEGKFDPTRIEVRVKNKAVPLQEVNWNAENRVVEIYPEEPIPAGSSVELVFSNVKNPTFGGIYYFNCQVMTPGDVPLLRYLGTWVLSIS